MKPDNDLKLLDAVLTDEDWASHSAQIRETGIASLRGRKRAKARVQLAIQLFVLSLFVGIGAWLLKSQFAESSGDRLARTTVLPSPQISRSAPKSTNYTPQQNSRAGEATQTALAQKQPVESLYITEEQMLKMFPAGSCLVAEVNGQKQLVFLDTH